MRKGLFIATLTASAVIATSVAGGASAQALAPLLDRAHNTQHPDWPPSEISPAARRARAERIRDTAAMVGMTNAVLLAGIGQVETGFAHCWSEATWACEGPASSSCEGGPVIAGAADGPCSLEQGGLGMFQFDSGTFSDTISTYGPNIVTIEGNVEAVVPFLVTRAIQSVDGVDDEQGALDWMNSIQVVAGDPDFEAWIYFVAWRYNGCKGCTAQQKKYRDGTLLLLEEMGADFWNVSGDDACEPIAGAERIIEEDDACFSKRGPPEYWRTESAGHGGALLWTKATDSASPSNYGLWRLRFADAGDYEIFVESDGGTFGQSTEASYQVSHSGGSDSVTIDQSSASGWRSLGVFSFDAGEGQEVRLDDNTGEPWAADPGGVKLAFDALRVVPVGGGSGAGEGPPDGVPGKNSGGLCSLSSGGATGAWPLLLVLWVLCRRERDLAVVVRRS